MGEFEVSLKVFLHKCAEIFGQHNSTVGRQTADALLRVDTTGVQPADREIARYVGDSLERAATGPHRELCATLNAVHASLHWRTWQAPANASANNSDIALASIAGPEPEIMIVSGSIRFGVLAMAPGAHYPPHSHEAEELYLALGGTAEWRKGDSPFAPVEPGTFVHHPPWMSHAMKTNAEPLLTLWAWAGNIDTGTYRMDAEAK